MDFSKIIDMFFILSLFIIGLLSFLYPNKAASFCCLWRFNNKEPLKGYVKLVKIFGFLLILLTVISMILLILGKLN